MCSPGVEEGAAYPGDEGGAHEAPVRAGRQERNTGSYPYSKRQHLGSYPYSKRQALPTLDSQAAPTLDSTEYTKTRRQRYCGGCVSKMTTVVCTAGQVFQRELVEIDIGMKPCERGRLSEDEIKYHEF